MMSMKRKKIHFFYLLQNLGSTFCLVYYKFPTIFPRAFCIQLLHFKTFFIPFHFCFQIYGSKMNQGEKTAANSVSINALIHKK